MTAVDKGLWITWYNLPGDDPNHLKWTHESWMPKVLSNPGVLWAAHYKVEKKPTPPRVKHTSDPSVGNGNDYILMFGGESAHVFARNSASFFRGAADRWAVQQTDQDKRRLVQRTGVRVAIMTEEERCYGVESGHRGGRHL